MNKKWLNKLFLALLAVLAAKPLFAQQSYFLEIIAPPATAVLPSSFTVVINVRDSSNGDQIIPPSAIPGAPNITLTPMIGALPGNGTLNPNTVTLSSPTISFMESYTAAESIHIHGSVMFGTVTVSGDSDLIQFNPGPYVKLLQLLPGETAIAPGSMSLTGKTGAPTNETVNTPFGVVVKAVDQYWNVVPGVSGTAQLATIPPGFLSGPTSQAFSGGIANFTVAITTPYFNMTVEASDITNGGITPQTSVVSVYGSYYFNVIVPSSATAGMGAAGPSFPVTIELRDLNTGNLIPDTAIPTPSPTVTLTILESGSPGPGTTGTTSIPLSHDIVSFNETYTRAAMVTLRAQATIGNAVSGNSVPFTVFPSSYTQVLLLMPWDTPRVTGVPSATGKTSAPPPFILAGALQSVTVRAVDGFWNIVTNSSGTANLDTVPSGFVSGVSSVGFSGGLASFTISIATVGYNIGIEATDSAIPGIFPQADSVNVFPPGLHYEILLPPSVVMTPQTFSMTVNLRDGTNTLATFATHGFNLSAVQTTPAAGFTFGTVSGMLSGGTATIPTQTISRTGTFKASATDAFGFTGTSALTIANPENHHYVVGVPPSIVFGVPFTLQVTRIDNATGLPVARIRTLAISAFFAGGAPLTPPATISLTSALMTLGSQGYGETYSEPNEFVTARSIYFLIQPNLDGDGLSPYSTLSATSPVIAVTVGGPGTLSLKVIAPLLSPGGQATLQAIIKDTPEGHRMPGVPLSFTVAQGTATVVPTSAVTDSSGSAQTILQTVLPASPLYEVDATTGVLIATAAVVIVSSPTTTLTTNPLGLTDTDGSLLIKTNTQVILTGHSQAGIAMIQYQLDGGALTVYGAPFTLPLGIHVLTFFSTDVFGQVGPASTQVLKVSAGGTGQGQLVNYPNPFHAGAQLTTLEYNLPQASDVHLRIYNGVGERVLDKTFHQGDAGTAQGVNQYGWDGRTNDGHVVGNGVYHAVLDCSAGRLHRTIVVVK